MCVLRVSCGKPSNTAIHLHFLLVYKFILLPISGDIWNADFLLDLPHYLSFRQTRKTDFRYPKNATRSMEVVSAAIPEARSRAQRPWRHTSCRPGPKAAARQERGNGGTINAQPGTRAPQMLLQEPPKWFADLFLTLQPLGNGKAQRREPSQNRMEMMKYWQVCEKVKNLSEELMQVQLETQCQALCRGGCSLHGPLQKRQLQLFFRPTNQGLSCLPQ